MLNASAQATTNTSHPDCINLTSNKSHLEVVALVILGPGIDLSRDGVSGPVSCVVDLGGFNESDLSVCLITRSRTQCCFLLHLALCSYLFLILSFFAVISITIILLLLLLLIIIIIIIIISSYFLLIFNGKNFDRKGSHSARKKCPFYVFLLLVYIIHYQRNVLLRRLPWSA